jgi:glycosyltransferase involved in cell wall biosynthesis
MKEGKISILSKVVFVNNGSKDKTWEIIKMLYEHSALFSGINPSGSSENQNVLMAGLMTVREYADMVILMDVRDDINAIDRMIDRYLDGCDIVYGVRGRRATDSFFKRFAAEAFYRLMNLMRVETVFNHADFRLMSKRALDALAEFKEVNLFLCGIIPMIGFKTDIITYERNERFDGGSNSLKKKVASQ